MTGRDLIIYIMRNHLEDELVFKDGMFTGFIGEDEVAARYGVGVATIRAWYECGMIKGFKIGDSLFFLKY